MHVVEPFGARAADCGVKDLAQMNEPTGADIRGSGRSDDGPVPVGLAITPGVMDAQSTSGYGLAMFKQDRPERPVRVGDLLKEWRARRRLSQLDLALEAGVSQRHLSFVESGRSSPSRDLVETLSEHLGLPLRERNTLLLSAGFAPAFAERTLLDPSMAPARAAVELVLKAHEPNPALAVDRYWRLIMANAAVAPLLNLVSEKALTEGAINVLRISLHPGGLAPYICNLARWKAHVLWRLGQQIAATCDPKLIELERELAAYPVPPGSNANDWDEADAIALPFALMLGDQVLSFITTTTVFGTPTDVTLSELAVETFFPANAETAAAMQAMAKARQN